MTTLHPFDNFVRDYRRLVFETALRLLGNFTEAQDIAQEVFLRAFQHFSEVGHSPRVGGWLRTVTRHLCLNYLSRYRGRWRFFSELTGPNADDDFEAGLPAADAGDPGDLTPERKREFQAALAALPPRQRTSLQLFYFEELDYQEIARRLGISLSQVKNNLFRGRRTLRRRLCPSGFRASGSAIPNTETVAHTDQWQRVT